MHFIAPMHPCMHMHFHLPRATQEFQASIEKLSKELFRLSKDSEEKGRSLKERYQELRAQSSALRDLEARYQITGAAHDESQQKLEEKTNRFNQLNAKYNKKGMWLSHTRFHCPC